MLHHEASAAKLYMTSEAKSYLMVLENGRKQSNFMQGA